MIDNKRISLLKPTPQTPFHIDFDWWKKNDSDWHIAVRCMLCPEHQAVYGSDYSLISTDWIDPETGEVRQMDGLQTTLIEHCAKQSGFLDTQTVFIEAIFRLFLANGNQPLTPVDIADRLKRSPDIVLKTISGPRVYLGIRPYKP